MSIVKFPQFNLEFEVSKIAFSILGVNIYNYAFCIVTGIIIGIFLCRISKEKFDIDFDTVLENIIIGLVFGIIGARFYYILFNLDYYKSIVDVLNFRDGGLGIYGGLIFGAVAIIINCKIKKVDILNFLDYIIPFVAIAQSIGRWGNFFNIEAFGTNTNTFFRMGIETGLGYREVHPVFLYESVSTFTIFFILRNFQKNRKFKGQILLSYCLMYSGIRAILEGLRVDSLMLFKFRISQILSIFIFGVSILVYFAKKRKSENEYLEPQKNL